ncbi:MAG: PilZ domain-containing protein [Croceibacterium sp.]
MTVLTIRSHKRYATRQPVRLRSSPGPCIDGLLIELSSEGCRISNLHPARFEIAQPVTVVIGDTDYAGVVRWSHDGIAGVRLDRALHGHEIAGLLEQGGRPAAPLQMAS